MQIIVDGLLTNYEIQGKGKLVLLLHGWGDTLRGLDTVQAALQKDYRTLAIDLPGFGKSQAPKEAWGLTEYSQFLGHFLQKLKIEDPYALLGHSNGGAITITAVGRGTITPRKVVLLGSSGIRSTHNSKRALYSVGAKIAKTAIMVLPKKYREALRRKSYSAIGSDFLVVPELAESFKKIIQQDVQEDAAKITIPALLIFARDDEAVPYTDGVQFHELIKGSLLETLETGGHFMHRTQPDTVNRAILEFLK